MAFLHSGPARQPVFNAPPVVVGLIALLVGAHVLRLLLPDATVQALLNEYAFIPARYSASFLASHNADPGNWVEQAVPFVSYMALHAGWAHLALNSLWLLAFGPVVSRRFGPLAFLAFFIVCGVLAAAAFLAAEWSAPVSVIGASGAISGLMAAAIRIMPTQMPWLRPGEGALAPIWSRQVLGFSAVWAALNVVIGVTGLNMGGEMGPVAWQAHLGGYAAGLVLAGPFDALRRRKFRPAS